MPKNIYVGNLSYDVQECDLNEVFGQFGEIEKINIIFDRETNRSKGFGFVEMADEKTAEAAISALNGTELLNREMRVNMAREKNDRY